MDSPVVRRRIRRTAGLVGLPALGLVVAQMVLAAPPTADFSTTDTTPLVGQDITFNGNLSTDEDGDIALYEWDFDYVNGNFTVDATGASVTHSYGTPGGRTVALRVTDTDAVDGTVDVSDPPAVQSLTVSAPPNQPPTATIDCPPGPVNVATTVSCTGVGSDLDGTISEYEWSVDGGPFTDGAATFSTSFPTGGNHSVGLRVRDNNGTPSPVVTDTVAVNASPVASIVATAALPALPANTTADPAINQGSPPTPIVGQVVQLDSSGSTDVGGSIASRAWDVDGNGFNDGTGETLDYPFTTAGAKTVRVQVTDNNGATHIASLGFRVNRVPTASFITDNPTPVIDQSVEFSSRSSDPDNDITAYAWDFDNDGQFGEDAQSAGIICQSPLSPNASCQFANAGIYTVRLRATDAGGISHVATRQIRVQSTVPNAAFAFSPNSPLPGQAVTFTSTSTPSPGKRLSGYQWDFSYDGVTFTPEATGLTVTRAFTTPGPKSVALRVSEEAMPGSGTSTGGDAIVSRTVTVNAPPSAAITISPATAFVRDPVVISSRAADPDGPLASHSWDLDDDGRFDDATGPVVSTSYSSAGRHTVRLRVTDSKGAVATATGVATVRTRPLTMLSGVLIRLNGAVAGDITHVARLTVKAPRGAKIKVKCKGKGCPKQAVKRGRGRTIRFKALERGLPAGIKLTILVSKPGFLGRQTTFTMREARRPKRVDLCLAPGAKRAKACPS